MKPNKQIDHGTLEWFDCKNNFPPMSIDLYVDSEHGYGIGRLGRRVKDKSIIWTVHLDSGEVYMVYAFYKVKRWAYMPKDEKTNTKLKHELMLNKERSWVPCYLKSEADKWIADLEESHKKEVGQLLIEIAELKKEKEYVIEHTADVINGQECEIQRQKYKRCFAMAQEWRNYASFCGMQSSCHNHRGFGKTAEKYTWKECHAWKCVKRLLKLAEKFKESK